MVRETVRRLQLAFRLVDADVTRLAKKKERGAARTVAALGRDVLEFLGATDGALLRETAGVWFGSGARSPSVGELRELQVAVRRLLDAIVSGLYVEPPELRVALAPVRLTPRLMMVQVIDGSVRDRYLLALHLLFAQVGADRVRQCPACGGAFLKVSRRTYCQRPACRRRRASSYWQKYKRTPKGRAALRRHYQRMYDTVYAEHGWRPGARTKTKRRAVQGTRST